MDGTTKFGVPQIYSLNIENIFNANKIHLAYSALVIIYIIFLFKIAIF